MNQYCYACPVPGLLSADAQKESLRLHCERTGLAPEETFEDTGHDAWELPLRDRDGGRRLLARIAPGDEVIIATPQAVSPTLSGYGRIFNALAEVGVRLTLAGATADVAPKGKAQAPIPGMGRLARLLGDATRPSETLAGLSRSERSKAGLAYARAKGRRTSKYPPIGFRWQRRGRHWYLAPDERERQVVRLVLRWRGEGRSWAAIAGHLLRHKVTTAAGLAWDTRRLRRAVEAVKSGRLQLGAAEASTGSPTGTESGE